MPKIEILRPEGPNLGGLFYRVILLPVAFVESYDPAGKLEVDNSDIQIQWSGLDWFVLEATPKTVNDKGAIVLNQFGLVNTHEIDLRLPSDQKESLKKLIRLAEYRYFIVFARDMNTIRFSEEGGESPGYLPPDNRWKVYGTKSNPMEVDIAFIGDPRGYGIKLSGAQQDAFPWWYPAGNPETWLND